MASIIEMPKLSDTMTEGTLSQWLKKEGDSVESGDMIASVETDKATMEVECFDDGVILKVYVQEGDSVPVGAPICAVGEAGEKAPEAGAAASGAEAPATAEAREEAQSSGEGTEAAADEATASDARVKASPLAKKVAADKGVDISKLTGTGPGGRIIREDVEAAAKAVPAKAAPAPKSSGAPVTVFGAAREDVVTKVNNMRGTIARRLLESKTTVPHFYLQTEMDVGPLLAMRKRLNDALADEGVKFTVNDFILKASIEALRRVPEANSSWQGDKIVQYGAIHMAFAVAIDDGLVTPTIRDADRKSLRQISAEAKELAVKARDRKLTPNEMSGGTFTISNLGMFGITNFYGIINPPNGAILNVGATVKKPVVNKKDEIVIGQRMNISMSCDHRVVDGAVGAKFLAALKMLIEAPEVMLA